MLAYAELKRDLAEKRRNEWLLYTDAKTDLVTRDMLLLPNGKRSISQSPNERRWESIMLCRTK
jgi:hypothetical protein